MGWGSLFGRNEKPRTTLSNASSFSKKVGQNGGICTHSEHTQSCSQPRTTSSTAPTFANNPWLSAGEHGEIAQLSEYAHPSRLSPHQSSKEYHSPQPHPQGRPQARSKANSQSHPQPAQRPVQTAARRPNSTKAKAYFPPQHPNQNQSYSMAGSSAHQPAVRGAGDNNRDFHSSPAQQRSTQLSREPLPSMGYVLGSGFYGNSNQDPAYLVSSGASVRGQHQGLTANKPLSLSTPGPSGQGQFQESKKNRDGVSPMETQQPFEFLLETNIPGRLGTYHHSS